MDYKPHDYPGVDFNHDGHTSRQESLHYLHMFGMLEDDDNEAPPQRSSRSGGDGCLKALLIILGIEFAIAWVVFCLSYL